jgi:predicted nucleic acid-binding protein
MARSARRRTERSVNAAHALVLDAQGLSKAAAGDPRVAAWIARARELRLPLVVNAVTLTETIRGGGRDAAIHLLTRNAHVDDVDGSFAIEAGRLLGRLRRSDTIDALVATSAIKRVRPVVVLTSDPVDLEALTADHPQVQVVAV